MNFALGSTMYYTIPSKKKHIYIYIYIVQLLMNGQYLNTVTETLFIDINTPIF